MAVASYFLPRPMTEVLLVEKRGHRTVVFKIKYSGTHLEEPIQLLHKHTHTRTVTFTKKK